MQFRNCMATWQTSVSGTHVLVLWVSHIGHPKRGFEFWHLNGQNMGRKNVAFKNRCDFLKDCHLFPSNSEVLFSKMYGFIPITAYLSLRRFCLH